MRILTLCTFGLGLGFALACTGGTTAPEVVTPPPPPPPAAADGSIGVRECDDYIMKMEACIAKMDAATKPTFEASLKSTRDAWAASAATPEGRSALAMSCSAAAPALASMPCENAATTGTTDATGEGTSTAIGSAADKAAAAKAAAEKAAAEKAAAEKAAAEKAAADKAAAARRAAQDDAKLPEGPHRRPGSTTDGSTGGAHSRPK